MDARQRQAQVFGDRDHRLAREVAEGLLDVLQDGDELVELYFADNGKGIPVEHRERVFDPFFTTRRDDGGSGLGLHIVHGIVTQTLKGSIALEMPDRGLAFRISFPRLLAAAAGGLTGRGRADREHGG